MGSASFVQTSFQGGEWSPLMQGRIDLPKYATAMNLCQNVIPIEEGAAPRRSGTQRLSATRSGNPGRVIGWAPKQDDPYILEFTDSYLRFYQGWSLYTDVNPPTVSSISSATPALVTLGSDVTWITGNMGQFVFPAGFPGATTGPLQNRQFVITMVTAATFTIADPVSGDPIDGSGITLPSGTTFARITELASPYQNGAWANVRFIPFTDSQNITRAALISGQEPQLLTATTPGENTTVFSLENLAFTDGPYLDPVNGAVATLTVGSGTPTYRFATGNNWSPSSGLIGRYNTGDGVEYQGFLYLSTTGGTAGTNTDNVPGTNSAWVLVNPTPPNPTPPLWDQWVSGGSYTVWNGTGNGSIVYNNGVYYAAINRGDHAFNGSDTPVPNPVGLTNSWAPLAYVQVSDNISGIITMNLSFSPWSALNTYAQGDVASFGTGNYQSLQSGNVGNEPDTSPTWWTAVNAGVAFGPNGAQPTDVGRLIRLFYQPATWVATTTYEPGQQVTFNGAYYTALTSNTGDEPDQSLVQWAPVSGIAFWTPGIVVGVSGPTTIQVQLTGAPLTDATPISLYEVGVYTNTNNQWPTCGLFYGGRLWLAGAVPNRIDSSTSDDPLVWTPTGPDGTVADNDGISLVCDSDDDETIVWMKGVTQGILVGTLTREWLINSSVTNDPITPATVSINPVTKYGGAFVEPKATGLATVFVQKFKRQLMEMVANVFSGKYNAPNLALTARHLTAPNIEELTYQEELAPVIWARMGDGSLAGCTYRRLSAIQTDNPVLLNEPSTFAAWHRHPLGTGRKVTSITTTLTPEATLDQLAMVTQATTGQGSGGSTVTPQIWFQVDGGDWNGSSSADPFTGVGGLPLTGMTGPFFPTFFGNTGFDGTLNAVYPGGWSTTDRGDEHGTDDGGMQVANGSASPSGVPITYINGGATMGGENYGWVRGAAEVPPSAAAQTFTIYTNQNAQDWFMGIATSTAALSTYNGASAGTLLNVAVLLNNGEVVINGTQVLSGGTFSPTQTSTINVAILNVAQPASTFVSQVEVMQPLADVDDTLLDGWFLDGAITPSSQTIADTNTEVVFYGLNHAIGDTVTVWAAGLDLGDYTVASDGSVTVPIGAANGLFTLTLAQSFDGAIPAVIGTCFTSRGQIVRPAEQQKTGSRIGPAQGETRREHMFNTLLFNTQGISFGTNFDYLYPATFQQYLNGPEIPVTELFSGIYWDTIESDYNLEGTLCWQVTRPYPATVVNIGGWIHTQER
jgi:hypothetical protein